MMKSSVGWLPWNWDQRRVSACNRVWDYFLKFCILATRSFNCFHKKTFRFLSCNRQCLSCNDCLEGARDDYQNCSVLYCVAQCALPLAHWYEQFLQVKQDLLFRLSFVCVLFAFFLLIGANLYSILLWTFLCSLFFSFYATLLWFIAINCAIWSTDHKVVINLSWVELSVVVSTNAVDCLERFFWNDS